MERHNCTRKKTWRRKKNDEIVEYSTDKKKGKNMKDTEESKKKEKKMEPK